MIYLIKKDGSFNTFTNVIEWNERYCILKAGKGTAKIYAGEDEYFSDREPVNKGVVNE